MYPPFMRAQEPRPSFRTPVVAPTIDPDDGETVSVCFSRQWLPYVLGALQQLWLPTTWQGSDGEIIVAQERALQLMEIFASAGECEMQGITDLRITGRLFEYSKDGGATWLSAGVLACCETVDTAIRCRTAFGLVARWSDHLLTALGTFYEVYASLNDLDPDTFNPLVDNYGLTPDTYEQLRQVFIDITDEYDSYSGTYPTFPDYVSYMIDLYNAFLDDTRCKMYAQVTPAGDISQDLLYAWFDAVEHNGDGSGALEQFLWFKFVEIARRTLIAEFFVLAQEARVSEDEYDCTGCAPVPAWCHVDDLEASSAGWEVFSGSASYVEGVGFVATDAAVGFGVQIKREFSPDTRIDSVTIRFSETLEADDDITVGVVLYHGGSIIAVRNATVTPDGTVHSIGLAGSTDVVDEVHVLVFQESHTPSGNNITVSRVQLGGFEGDESPFGGSNC